VIAVGATMVGSISFLVQEGAPLKKGQQQGYFQFGGSTVALVFEAGRVQWDADFRAFSSQNVEIFVLMGSRIGVFLH